MEKRKITVGVPIYNQNPKYFLECLKSIKNQTYQDFECIILDDGSDDKEEVEKVTKEFGFKYIYQKNAGIGAARQAIVDNASKETEFITYLSSDDIWDKKFLEIMIKTAEEQPGKILYSNYHVINEKGEIIKTPVAPTHKTHEDFCIDCWETAYRNSMFTNFSTTFFPKEVFEKVRMDKKFRFGEDLDFLLRSMKHFEYYLVPEYLLKYLGEGNLTSRVWNKIAENDRNIREKCLKYWRENE